MMGLKTLLLLASLLAVLDAAAAAAADRKHHGGVMPGSPYNISKNDHELQRVVLSAAYAFNNQSNEAFLFKPSVIIRAQRQIVKGVRYVVEFKISRTVCRKRDNSSNLPDCDFQPEGPLHQTFRCHLEVWMIPWQNETKTQELVCKP